jgi:hypothetical protein
MEFGLKVYPNSNRFLKKKEKGKDKVEGLS